MPEMLALGDVLQIQRGTTYKSGSIGQAGPVLLGLGAIERNGGFRGDNLRTYGGESPDRLLVNPGQLFLSLKDVTQTADLLGAVARLPANLPAGRLTQDTVRLDLRPGLVSTQYLYWMLRTPQYRDYCRSHATGTTNLGLSRDDFFAYRIPKPTPSRETLVELLDALDDKIAANTTLARAADKLACAIFVEIARRATESDLTFAECCAVGGGGTPSTAEPAYWDGDINWATPTDITALTGPYLHRTARTITTEGLANCSSSLYPPGSILMTSRATIGAFALAVSPTAVNQGFIVVNPIDERIRYWIFHEMRSRVDEFLAHANGATFLELSRGNFRRIPVRLGDHGEMLTFNERARALHGRASQAITESEALAKVRDALLPLLISGRLRVREAEQIVSDQT